MKHPSPQTFGGFWRLFLKSLTFGGKKAFNNISNNNKNAGMCKPLSKNAFTRASNPVALPGDVRIVGFEAEAYNWAKDPGEIGSLQIAEMLVRLENDQGPVDNETYFKWVHEHGFEAQVDHIIVMTGVDYAVENDLMGKGKVAAFNIFIKSLTTDLINDLTAKLKSHGLNPSSCVLELLEHKTAITPDRIAVARQAIERGFYLSLDDLDPRKPFDLERIAAFGEAAQILKVDRGVWKAHKANDYPGFRGDLEAMITHGEQIILLEGVTRAQHDELSKMPSVRATQSMWDTLPVRIGK